MQSTTLQSSLHWLSRGFKVRWQRIILIFLINTAFAICTSVDDDRPFIHPFISVQSEGFAIAYFVACFHSAISRHPIRSLITAVTIGTIIGLFINIVIKIATHLYTIDYYIQGSWHVAWSAFWMGLTGFWVSLLFVSQARESHHREAVQAAEVERQRLSRRAIEAELKLMQAQVEPHFLFNTLSNVQFLVETNPPAAANMLEHLSAYLRAAIPQLRQHTTTLEQEAKLAESYLAILQMRMGKRLRYRVEIPPHLAGHEIPPMMLLSLVENAIKHGVEPAADGGEINVSAHDDAGVLHVMVRDTGRGLIGAPGNGVGLSNIKERLRAIYGERGRLCLQENTPRGVIASIEIPEAEDERA